MKVALLFDFAEESWPSMELYGAQLAAALERLPSPPEILRVQPRRPLPPIRGRVGNWLNLAARWLVYPSAARRVRADVYHVLDHSYGHLVAHLPGGRVVVTCHDLAPLAMSRPAWSRPAWSRPEGAPTGNWPGVSVTERLWLRSVEHLRDAAHIVAVSRNTKADLERFLQIPPERIPVIGYGVEAAFSPVARERRDEVRARLRLPLDAPLILHVGSCIPRKNVSAVLRALARIREHAPVRLLQVGGRFRAEERAIIRDEQLDERVFQIPHVPHAALPAIYSAADVLAFPSAYEGFGLPVLEALACGTPVVCSSAASLPEVAGDAAVMVAPDDVDGLARGIQGVLEERALAEALRAEGLTRAREFTWERVVRDTMQVYEDCLAR